MPDPVDPAAFVAAVVARAGTDGPRAALAGAARALASGAEVTLDEGSLRLFDGSTPAPVVPPEGGCPELLGVCFEALLTDREREAGAHHTPEPVAARVVTLALDDRDTPESVCDPAVGGGVFLLAAARHLHRSGLDRREVLDRLWGFDTDPLAVAVTEAGLYLWAAVAPSGDDRLAVGDFLDGSVAGTRPDRGWSIIVGNPPFQSQLAGSAVRDRERAAALRHRFGPAAGGYVDTAGLFVLAGLEHLAERGRLALVLPASLMATADGEALRRTTADTASVRSFWVPDRQPFPAAVDVVVPVFERDRPPGRVEVTGDDDAGVRATPDPGPRWSLLLADAEGVPRVALGVGPGTVADRAEVTAGFRQHFYALAGAVREGGDGDGRPLLTVGLVDPLTSLWGRRPTRLDGVGYGAPVVDPDAVEDDRVAAWVADRWRPKILVATQTRVIEAVVDPGGTTVPSTPLISVEPHEPGTDLWLLAAVLCAPPVTAWLHQRGAGGGLSRGRIRPTASLIRQVPLPVDGPGWQTGATLARQASAEGAADTRRRVLVELGRVMTAAYGADDSVTAWWAGRLPRRRG